MLFSQKTGSAGHLPESVEVDASYLPLRGSAVDNVYIVLTSVLGYVGEDYDFALLRRPVEELGLVAYLLL